MKVLYTCSFIISFQHYTFYLFRLRVETRQLWLYFRASQSSDESKSCTFNTVKCTGIIKDVYFKGEVYPRTQQVILGEVKFVAQTRGKIRLSLHSSLSAHPAGVCPSFHSMKRLRVLLLPPGRDAIPSQGYPPLPAFHQASLTIH